MPREDQLHPFGAQVCEIDFFFFLVGPVSINESSGRIGQFTSPAECVRVGAGYTLWVNTEVFCLLTGTQARFLDFH